MLLGFGERNFFAEVANLTVDFHAHESRRAQFVENVLMRALFLIDNRREQRESRALVELENLRENLIDALTFDGLAAFGTVRFADACEEQSQIVVNLRDGADSRARIIVCRLLIDCDCRT